MQMRAFQIRYRNRLIQQQIKIHNLIIPSKNFKEKSTKPEKNKPKIIKKTNDSEIKNSNLGTKRNIFLVIQDKT